MKPSEYRVGHYMEENLQLLVPAYQRPYTWGDDRLVDLWRDVANQYRNRGKRNSGRTHFMGAVILEHNPDATNTGYTAVNVIDGQQRLLTMLVLMAAVRDQIHYLGQQPIDPDNDLVLIKPKYGGSKVSRVLPKPQDHDVLHAVTRGDFVNGIDEDAYDHPLAHAYEFFRFQAWLGRDAVTKHTLNLPPRPGRGNAAPPKGSLDPWGRPARGATALDLMQLQDVVTNSLSILELMLEASDEEAGVIFETMNAKSTPLRQFDLLRNSIFVRMPKTKDQFYSDVWEHVETTLDAVSYSSLRDKPHDQFFYEYVIGSGGAGVSKDSLHRRWLSAVIEELGYGVTARTERRLREEYVDPLTQAALLYPIAVGQRTEAVLYPSRKKFKVNEEQQTLISEIMATSGGPLVPIILKALSDRFDGAITDATLTAILFDLQSYLVRLMLAGESFSPLRASMMVVASKIPSPITLPGLRKALREADWKTDQQVLDAVSEVNTNSWASKALFPVLRGIERQLSGISAHPMPFGNKVNHFSIEHIYPQTNNPGPGWEADLRRWGVDRDEMDSRKYALGNLTAVTGFDNRKNGKKRFTDKQTLLAATADLKLHKSFQRLTHWTPERIDQRSTQLATVALQRWPRH